MTVIVLALALSVTAACADVLMYEDPIEPFAPEKVDLAPPQSSPSDRDCAALEDAYERAYCEDSAVTEQETVLANLRPPGVPFGALDADEIRRSLRERRSRVYPIPAEAQTEDPALLLARMTVSEEGWANYEGMQALYQVARSVRGHTCVPERHTQCENGEETILSALRRLSPHVSGMRSPTRWRQYWTSTLPSGASEWPARLWRECWEGAPRGACEGDSRIYRPLWTETLRDAELLLSLSSPPIPCRGIAAAWGCADCGDDHFMARRNARRVRAGRRPYEQLVCPEEVNNRIWGLPPT